LFTRAAFAFTAAVVVVACKYGGISPTAAAAPNQHRKHRVSCKQQQGLVVYAVVAAAAERVPQMATITTKLSEGTVLELVDWVVKKRRKISPSFYSLSMMFGSNLKRREVIRCLVDAFGGCSAGIRRLGKEIES
jgi:hypothetical protein